MRPPTTADDHAGLPDVPNPAIHTPYAPADYLAWEASEPQRHEYWDGEVFAMAGAEDRHITICGNAYIALRQHLQGTPYRTFMADMKVQVAAVNCYFYPDIVVTCSPRDVQDRLIKREPTLVIEVLSPSTAGHDRGAKFGAYRQLPSLQEYVLIDPDTRTTDVYRNGADGLWVLHPFVRGEAVAWASVTLTISPAQLFAEVDDDTAPARFSSKLEA